MHPEQHPRQKVAPSFLDSSVTSVDGVGIIAFSKAGNLGVIMDIKASFNDWSHYPNLLVGIRGNILKV